jgi:hypothetical protein
MRLNRIIHAPVGEVFAFFDDVGRAIELNDHAVSFRVVGEGPDGRRTVDVRMRAGAKDWTQTIEQVVREPPTRLVTEAWTWTTDRSQRLMTVSTERRFTSAPDGTHVEVTLENRLAHPWRRPYWAILNGLTRGAARRKFEDQLDEIAARIEAESGYTPPG